MVIRRTQLKGLPAKNRPLRARCVLLPGLGAVGGSACVELARAGVGQLEGVDPGHYRAESFLTQPTTENVARRGEPKASALAASAHAVNPAARVRCTAALVQDIPLRLLYDADIWLVAGDNAEMVVWLGERAVALGKVLMQGAVHPDTCTSILRAWDLRRTDAACPACALGPQEWATLDERDGCDPNVTARIGSIPTRTLSPICRTTGQLMAFEALKRLSGNENLALSSEELTYSLWTHRAIRTELSHNPACRTSHEAWNVANAPAAWDQISPEVLMQKVGAPLKDAMPVVRAEIPWMSFGFCQACQWQSRIRRFGSVAQAVGRCDCGGALVVPPAGVRSMVPAADLDAIQHCSLASLGLPPDRGIGLFVGERWHYFLPPPSIFDFAHGTTRTSQEEAAL